MEHFRVKPKQSKNRAEEKRLKKEKDEAMKKKLEAFRAELQK